MKTAFITGVTGQDGRYLAQLLLDKGYRVMGCARTGPSEALPSGVGFRPCDVRDQPALTALVAEWAPDEVYHLAADSSVDRSWIAPPAELEGAMPVESALVDALRRFAPNARLLLASSSEVFAGSLQTPQSEVTPLAPLSPYGRAKAAGLELGRQMRQETSLFIASAILYNHESPRRPHRFVSRKVTAAVAAISAGLASEVRLGNLAMRRDWGYAPDFVEAMWRILQHDAPDDYVVGTGASHSVEELCAVAFERAGLDHGKYVVVDRGLFRPLEPVALVANASRARERLGWAPGTTFVDMIGEMVDADVARLREGPG